MNHINDMENAALTAEVSYEELKMVVFSMHPDKASGLDGLNPAFFQTFWSVECGGI